MNPLAQVPATVCSVVVFPDDYPGHQVAAYLSILRIRRPDVEIVIVTSHPALYSSMTCADGRELRALVLPKPSFSWSIVDAIRASAETGK